MNPPAPVTTTRFEESRVIRPPFRSPSNYSLKRSGRQAEARASVDAPEVSEQASNRDRSKPLVPNWLSSTDETNRQLHSRSGDRAGTKDQPARFFAIG